MRGTPPMTLVVLEKSWVSVKATTKSCAADAKKCRKPCWAESFGVRSLVMSEGHDKGRTCSCPQGDGKPLLTEGGAARSPLLLAAGNHRRRGGCSPSGGGDLRCWKGTHGGLDVGPLHPPTGSPRPTRAAAALVCCGSACGGDSLGLVGGEWASWHHPLVGQGERQVGAPALPGFPAQGTELGSSRTIQT